MLNYFTHLTNFKFFVSSTYSYVHIQSHDTCGHHEAGDWIWICEHVEDPKCFIFVRCFWCYYDSTKTSFGFCSCSELLQLKFCGKKTLQKIANCSDPNTVIGVTKVANERYLPYLQLYGRAFLWIFMYCRCTSGPKLG